MRLGWLRRPVDRRLELLQREVQKAQQIGLRAYEAAQQWPAALEEIRRAPDYEAPFEEREPLVTVRIPTYDRVELLCERALASVRAQTYERWEAVVVGDHSPPEAEERVRSLGDKRIRFINLPFRGPYPEDPKARWQTLAIRPMNRALREARGRWIFALDDDDEFDVDHIEVLLEHARETRAELAYGKLRVVDSRGRPLDMDISRWPPTYGAFNFLSSVCHAGLRRFEYDPACHLAGEVSDWNLVRRLWEANVRFSFLERELATYHYTPRVWP